MKKTFTKKKSAFSLIELSIVLIIIGLLIAGITGGASLIKSSELRSVMGEARGYAVAVNAFFTQYGSLPGDYNKAVGDVPTNKGDANGKIEYARDYDTLAGSEGALAWHMLKSTGAITDDITPAAADNTDGQVPGDQIPESKIKGAGWVFGYDASSPQNIVMLTGTTGVAEADGESIATNGDSIATAALIGADALSVDSKIDDGDPAAGKVRGYVAGCVSSGLYVTSSSSSKVCALSYQVDVNS